MFEIVVTASAKRVIKKLPHTVRLELVESSAILQTNPFGGERLSGSLSFLFSLHFSCEGKQYRAVYTVEENEKQVIIHFAGSRENFYEKVRRMFR